MPIRDIAKSEKRWSVIPTCKNCEKIRCAVHKGFVCLLGRKTGVCTGSKIPVKYNGRWESYVLRAAEETVTVKKLDLTINEIEQLKKIYKFS